MTATDHADQWVEEALERLADAGYRRGDARRQVLGLMSEQSCALSAIEIEDALAARPRRVSRASIYRILEELEQIGMVQRLDIGRGMMRYEPVRAWRRTPSSSGVRSMRAIAAVLRPGTGALIERLSDRVPLHPSPSTEAGAARRLRPVR